MNDRMQRIETTGQCARCDFEGAIAYWQDSFNPQQERWALKYCPTCEAENLEEQRLEALRERDKRIENAMANLRKRTPVRYLQTAVDHASFNRRLFAEASKWQPTDEKPWLGLVGATGTCKTRVAFERFKALLKIDAERDLSRRTWAFTTGGNFGALVLEQWGFGNEASAAARDELDRLRTADWLIFDEIGKVRPTPAIIDALFALIDHRHSHNKWTLWTANTPPEQFCTAFPEEFAAPLAGRLVELSTILQA